VAHTILLKKLFSNIVNIFDISTLGQIIIIQQEIAIV